MKTASIIVANEVHDPLSKIPFVSVDFIIIVICVQYVYKQELITIRESKKYSKK